MSYEAVGEPVGEAAGAAAGNETRKQITQMNRTVVFIFASSSVEKQLSPETPLNPL
jgi:hypothetical protein